MEDKSIASESKGAFRCPRCGSVTWGNLEFCTQCGQALNIECSNCGSKWRYIYGYAFCPSCGAQLEFVAM